MPRNKVFISYSHKDERFFRELQTMLSPSISNELIVVWDDKKIPVGSDWRHEIEKALSETCVAVMIVSPSFLASDFITKVELPSLLNAYKSGKLKVCWMLANNCRYDLTDLVNIQAAHDTKHPLGKLNSSSRQESLTRISKVIDTLYKSMQGTKKTITKPAKITTESYAYFCYSIADRDKATKLQNALLAKGIITQNDQLTQISIETQQAIRRSTLVFALITRKSNKSLVFKNKILFALEEAGKTVVPVILENEATVMPEIYSFPEINLAADWEGGLKKIIEKIRTKSRFSRTDSKILHPRNLLQKSESPDQNPFIFGSAVPTYMFVGRQTALNTIKEHVGNFYNLQSLSVVSNRRMGKTSLLRYINEKSDSVFPPNKSYVTVYIDAMDAGSHSISGFMNMIRLSLRKYRILTWKEKQDGDLVAFSEAIRRIASIQNVRLILLLDELEAIMAYKELDILLDTLRSFGSLSMMGIITATAHELSKLEYEGKLTSRFSNIFSTYFLGNFSRSESDDLIKRAFDRSRLEPTTSELNMVFDLAGGHPLLTQLSGSIIWKARREKKSQILIKKEYREAAKDVFSGILQRMTNSELELTKQLLGLRGRLKASEGIMEELKSRGVLTDKNEFFSISFADYAMQILRP